MRPCRELMRVLEPAYAPCTSFSDACSSLLWAPEKGYVPRGFLGATGDIDEVELVLVFAEPGDPHRPERNASMDTALENTYDYMKNGRDQFHRNVRYILDLCFPKEPFNTQLRKTWMTESLLCSAPNEGGSVRASAWRYCSSQYLLAQLELLPNSLVVALGNKAQTRLKSVNVQFVGVGAAAPPGCNFRGVKESWKHAAQILESRRSNCE